MESNTKAQIIDAFLRLWNDSRDRTTKFEETVKGPHHLFSENGKAILLGPDGIVAFNRLSTLLNEDPAISPKFSRKELEKRIHSGAIHLFNIERSEIKAQATAYVDQLLQQLENATPTNWEIYLPVDNLTVNQEIIIGRTLVKMFDETTEQLILDSFAKASQQNTSPPEVKAETEKLIHDQLVQNYTGRAVIRVETTAVDNARAVESAIELAETALNVLRFYSRGAIEYDARAYRMQVGLKGAIFSDKLWAVAFARETLERNMHFQSTGYLHPLELSQKELSHMENDSFRTLHEILMKEPVQRTAFEKLIINSVNLFGSAMNNPDTVAAFVYTVVALESILLKKGEPMKTLLAERIALLLGQDFNERMFYFEQASRLYQIRSDIVHRGFGDVTESDLFLLSIIAYRIFVRLIADSPRVNDIGKLVETCNRMKFGAAKSSK